jgi:alanyl-tRNA synthetase
VKQSRTSNQLRQFFLDFFAARGHYVGEPASLVPAGDPSVLFTTAGMQQFKPYYLGTATPPGTRATTCQRCFRTSDIENVGHTARHLTFFEMLGNFSFGDYFKEDAITWALEFSDELGIERERVWISVFGGDDEVPADDEAVELWVQRGIPRERIVPLSRKDNFWGPAGPSGPCGPCSELYYDWGPGVGCGSPDCKPGCDCDRFIEYWNLVFVQYSMAVDGTLTPLPKPSIDTGMGLERLAAVTQGVLTVFENDQFRPFIAAGEKLSGVAYESSPVATRALRTMAEHARGVAFLIMDGILPGNEGRDYVLRRIIRRAVQQAVAIGVDEPFLAGLCDLAVEQMSEAYPALAAQRDTILSVAVEEELRFRRTLDSGLHILNEALRRARDAGTELPAEVAFELHDTYGFPFDLTREIAQDEGMSVDEERFEHLMAGQRERARLAQRGGEWGTGPSEHDLFQRDVAGIVSEFVGYEKLEVFTVIRALRVLDDGSVLLKLAESPFYAEGGGQIADEGWIHTDGGKLAVTNVVKYGDDQVIVARTEEGAVANGERAKAMVNAVRRHQTACNHTATHLLHNALRLLVDDTIRQAGSMVRPDKLRFDFTTRHAPTTDELHQVEELVNRRIVENHPVRAFVTTKEYAAELGALAFFEEKYGEMVRVLEIDEFSRELCGGTHVSATSQIGLCKITASQSVGANTRRIEAVTSAKAIEYYRGLEQTLEEAGAVLKTDAGRVPAAIRKLGDQVAELKEALRSGGGAGGLLDELVAGAEPAGDARLVAARVDGLSGDDMLEMCDALRERLGEAAIVLAAAKDGSVAVVVALTDGLVGRGLHAQEILRSVTAPLGGKGGGRSTLARGGGANVAAVDEALAAGREQVLAALAG